MYSELKKPVCPKCEDPLFMDDPGVWYCETCGYTEYNNITECRSDFGCDNLVMGKDLNFVDMEDQYCQKPHHEGGNCLLQAHGEQEQFLAEQYELEEHMKHCNSDTCDCRFV